MIVDALCACWFRRLVLIHPIDDGIHQIRIDLQEFEEPLDLETLAFLAMGSPSAARSFKFNLPRSSSIWPVSRPSPMASP